MTIEEWGERQNCFPAQRKAPFGDILEAYLKAQERDKFGKPIYQSKGTTVLTDTFRRWMDTGVTKKSLALTNEVGNGVAAQKEFKEVADRYGLLKAERQWSEELAKFVRVPTHPPFDEAKVAQEKKDHRTWMVKGEQVFAKDEFKGSMKGWVHSLMLDLDARINAEGLVTVRDVVSLFFELHAKGNAELALARRKNPLNYGGTEKNTRTGCEEVCWMRRLRMQVAARVQVVG